MSKKLSTEEFIQKAKMIYGDLYDYSLTKYKSNKTSIKIICPTHGIFEQRPDNHLYSGGCIKCGNIKTTDSKKLSTEEFIQKAKEIHENLYDYSLTLYKNCYTKISIVCVKHGEFLQTPKKHLQGQGCPRCNSSKGEIQIRKWLTENHLQFEEQKRFSNCKNKLSLPFDFYLPDHNTCIEYDGLHHFEIVNWSKTNNKNLEKLNNTIINDDIREQFCKLNNIKLFRIPYYDFDNIESILSKELF